jgi:hypothetical protein
VVPLCEVTIELGTRVGLMKFQNRTLRRYYFSLFGVQYLACCEAHA